MRGDILIYSVFLALGLSAAYFATLPSESGEDAKVKVIALEPKSITEIAFTSHQPEPDVKLEVTAKKRVQDERFTFDFKKIETPKPAHTPEQPKPDTDTAKAKDPHQAQDKKDAADGAHKAPPAPVVTDEKFLGNEQMEDLLKDLNPLIATRAFTQVDDKQLEEFGLKNPQQRLSIKTQDGKTIAFAVGKKSYGSPQRFILEEGPDSTKRVLLVDDSLFDQMEKANRRLYDRRIIAHDFQDITKAEIKTPQGLLKKLSHTQKNKEGTLLWTEDEPDAAPKPSYDAFMDRIEKLRIAKYASPEDEEKLKNVSPFLTIVFEKDSNPLETMEFKKTLSADGKPAFFVTSQFMKTHGEIQASRLETIEKDLETVFKGK